MGFGWGLAQVFASGFRVPLLDSRQMFRLYFFPFMLLAACHGGLF